MARGWATMSGRQGWLPQGGPAHKRAAAFSMNMYRLSPFSGGAGRGGRDTQMPSYSRENCLVSKSRVYFRSSAYIWPIYVALLGGSDGAWMLTRKAAADSG